ncbi:MAG: 3-oxoacyl-[acyl-carrier-protein] synthase [Chthoniobacter sp.]|jgi:3-oxoacyl-[acyl-carrier-protein] synthase II|nr:3-oxoacyl-[acyl-carrier-protein] synthase [Chthoniobacter sp.]
MPVRPGNGDTRRRVVITGLGVVAANGLELAPFWSSIVKGESAAKLVTRFDTSQSPTRIAAEISNFDPLKYVSAKIARRLDTSHLYGVAAAKMAAMDAALDFSKVDPDRCGVVEGTSVSSHESAIRSDEGYQKRGARGVDPFGLVNGYSGAGCGEIAFELGVRGHAITCSSGSASGNDAIGYALQMIRGEDVEVMVAGGSEATLFRNIWGGLAQAKVMTRRNDTPQQSMRPFDKTRDGLLLGEGAGFLILEELSHALGRGAKIYAELLSHGRSCEGYHPVAPHPEGIGYHRAMQKALRTAHLAPNDVDYINAHGTATGANDIVETRAIKRLFGPHAARLAVSSTKPITGHLMGAAGAMETVITALAISTQIIPLTLNFNEPDPECDLDYVRGQSRPYPIRVALNLSSGFGGKNSCLVLRRFAGI